MKKYLNYCTLPIIIAIVSCSNAGGGGHAPNPNSIIGTSTVLNNNSYTAGDAQIYNITNGNISGLSLINANGEAWQTRYISAQNPTWTQLPLLPESGMGSLASTSAINSFGNLFAASVIGNGVGNLAIALNFNTIIIRS